MGLAAALKATIALAPALAIAAVYLAIVVILFKWMSVYLWVIHFLQYLSRWVMLGYFQVYRLLRNWMVRFPPMLNTRTLANNSLVNRGMESEPEVMVIWLEVPKRALHSVDR